jgi:putative transcriptional regulator
MRQIKLKVREALKAKGKTQLELAELTGIRQASISDLCRNKLDSANLVYLTKIADALGIEDIRELIDFTDEDETS